ncbi:hypothetical protein BJ166DRAFT_218023 [Pestalotiopsis sp. NC0098]|nr:hypothetical protein BJ166DRAFT_218023 [Pestalotiopsis sp. NC0098]
MVSAAPKFVVSICLPAGVVLDTRGPKFTCQGRACELPESRLNGGRRGESQHAILVFPSAICHPVFHLAFWRPPLLFIGG